MSDVEGVPLPKARAAKAKLRHLLREVHQLRGIGVAPAGNGYCVKVNLASRPSDFELPASIDGVPVIVEMIGGVEAL